ncbi:tail fiber domain-containing protein [Tahibacter amnicola]|uniref:Tail fiber domain-containing protein n=1 Tax=Tahibacter amnicola TaxID=2976241 RepID=A0ABY6BAY6_9GAMM|nr:tail fiber domain-containing protein [Tahibacter amnicola]UXI66849.1 tail fiber domain-containing protein [Tahibacter amnicola]
MSYLSRLPRTLSLVLAIGAACGSSALFAADAVVMSGGLRLVPQVAAPAYQLRVVGPDNFLHQRVYKQNDAISLKPTADGEYRYEITPSFGDFKRTGDEPADLRVLPVLTESGAFLVKDGVIISGPASQTRNDNGTREGPSLNDQVIPDDLIVQGSTCVGFDCVNNESFGFDTIRLKENNTRIKFEDTSSSAGFATNDWQLTANDSASGGANKFSIEDITSATVPFTVSGGAPTNSVFVGNNGKVGFRTSTPSLDLHVTTGDTPALRFEQTNASGFTAQTWDVAGNEANFFVRDLTSGSRLPFRIRPGAPTSSLDINATGLVGIGTASPSAKLHVNGSDGTTQLKVVETNATSTGRDLLRLENNGPARMRLRNNTTGNEWSFNAHDTELRVTQAGSATIAMAVQTNGNVTIAGTLTQSSDRAAKENFRPVDRQALLDKIAKLDITEWNFKTENEGVRHIGPMAQDFHAAFGLGERDDRIAPLDTSGVALAAVQGLQQELVERDQRIAALEAKIQKLDRLTEKLLQAQQVQEGTTLPASGEVCEPQTVATGL